MPDQPYEERKLGIGFWLVIGGLICCSVLYAVLEFYYSEENLVRQKISASLEKCRQSSKGWANNLQDLDSCLNDTKPASLVKIEARTRPVLRLLNSTTSTADYELKFEHFAGKTYSINLRAVEPVPDHTSQ